MVAIFQEFDLMKYLGEEEVDYLSQIWISRDIDKNHHFNCDLYESSNWLLYLKKGFLKILNYTPDGEEHVKYLVTPGNLFGETALLNLDFSGDFGVALLPSTVCYIPMAEVHHITKQNPALKEALNNLLGYKVQKLESQITALKFMDSRSRIIHFLSDYSMIYGYEEGHYTVINNLLTHREIANITSTSRPFVTKTLNQLKDEQWLDYKGHKLVIKKGIKTEV